MRNHLANIEDRLRATYEAVAATTVVTPEASDIPPTEPHGLSGAPERRRPRRLVAAMATLALLIGGGVTAVVLKSNTEDTATTQVATAPTTTAALPTQADATAIAGSAPTCGSELPRPIDLPDGYIGPARMPSSVEGQLVLAWSSATGSIVARWPADPQFQYLLGQPGATPDGQPSVSSAGTPEIRQTESGSYVQTTVFSLRNVPAECRTLQIDVLDTDRVRVDAGTARLSNKGLFVSNVPLVIASEERAAAPPVVGCNAPPGAAARPNRGGTVSGGVTYATPTEALHAFLEADSRLIRNQYLELRLPDGSIAYAKEQPMRPGSFVTVVYMGQSASGWSVVRWESSGC